ncbi:MAG TPA: ParB/RepB/Spo0J family partition protein [Dissulfurispiraceae bacterium]|nr:ParB/RepB/Spo0J family partition protein [Dissulfurispiraceae bacterium]
MELEFHQLDLRYEQLRVHRPARERRLLASLAERGQQVPVVVIAIPEEGNRFIVIDGYKRIRALKRLGRDTVRATVWDMKETEALILDRSLRTAEGETALEQGWLLSELHRSFNLSLNELALRFDRSASWVSRRLALVRELPESVQQKVRDGNVGAAAAMKYLVPMARAKRRDCERMAEAIARNQFSTREVEMLYEAWRKGPVPLRERVVAEPNLFLRARREIEQEPATAGAGEELKRELDIIGAIARRALRQWKEAAGSLDCSERAQALLCLEQTKADLTRLSDHIEKENHNARSKPENDNTGTSPQGGEPSADRPADEGFTHIRKKGDSFGIGCAACHPAPGESGSLPAGNPSSVCGMQRESGPGP